LPLRQAQAKRVDQRLRIDTHHHDVDIATAYEASIKLCLDFQATAGQLLDAGTTIGLAFARKQAARLSILI
jgi:hypothetical protein